MQLKSLFVFLMAIALVLPLATAFNCTPLDSEEYNFCNYIEDLDWSQSIKDEIIEDALDSGDVSLDGDFESIIGQEDENPIQLNQVEEMELSLDEEDKQFIIDFSSISLFFYVIFSFLKKYYLLLKLG